MVKIGLEVHVQLNTNTKLFCGCPNKFTNEPNTNVCEICMGFPGSKPRLNKKAFEYAIRIGLALNCKFPEEMFFSRKSYFYPDMPKNFQITQYEVPLGKNGYLDSGEKKIGITRVHMEEDPSRIVHIGSITKAKYILVDDNRSGTPLCEIVTDPDFTSPKEARIFLQKLSSILEYLGVYDSSIEGSMRVDSNISVAETRVEIKNISGFKDVEKALNYEIIRQNNVLRRNGKIERETRGWDAGSGVTRSLRSKEQEEEYGYIFEPDLTRITLDRKMIGKIKSGLPELADEKVRRYEKMGIQKDLALAITSEPDLAEMFEEVIKKADAKLTAIWFGGELKKTLNFSNLRIKDTGIKPEHLIKLLKMIDEENITVKSAEIMMREMVKNPRDPETMTTNMERIHDEEVLSAMAKEVMSENVRAILDYKAGKEEAFHFLVGQIMRKTKGRGDPETVRKVLRKLL